MPRITDKRYAEFLKTGLITPISKAEFAGMLSKVKHSCQAQARAVVILLYYSGRRPSEVLELPGANIEKKGQKLKIIFPTKKGGRYSLLYYPLTDHFKEVLAYSGSLYPTQFFGWRFRSHGNKKKRIAYKLKDGKMSLKTYERTNTLLRHYFKRWFGVTPYFFRHNRFSDMALKGASLLEIKHAKGAKDLKSVEPYTHLSAEQAKKISKYFK